MIISCYLGKLWVIVLCLVFLLTHSVVMRDLEIHVCDNLKYWYVNDDKCLGFSNCVVGHFHVIATVYEGHSKSYLPKYNTSWFDKVTLHYFST